MLIDVALMRRLSRFGHFPLLLMTIGLSLALNALIGLIWGHDPRSFPAPWSGASVGVGGGVEIGVSQIVSIVRRAAGRSGHHRVLPLVDRGPDARGRREPGHRAAGRRQRRAAVGDRLGRRRPIAAVTVMLQAQSALVSTLLADSLIIYGFVAATMGGFISLIGTFVGGLALGVIQQFVGTYFSTSRAVLGRAAGRVPGASCGPTGSPRELRLRDV